jgi:uncharacterized protein with HEPN domain
MTLPEGLYLRHMLHAIDRVIEATERTTKQDFDRDWMIQDAIMHELQVLGEAAGRVSGEIVDAHPAIPWRKITGLRHKVVHDYFVVDLNVIWDTATIDVPSLRAAVAMLCEELGA